MRSNDLGLGRIAWAALGVAVAGLTLGACALSSASDAEPPGEDASYGSGASATGTTSYTATQGSGGAGAYGEQPPAPEAGEVDPIELVACEGLDSSEPVVLYLSADDSNSMASPAHARELIRANYPAYYGGLRTYEFLNYYNVGYAPPETGILALYAQAEPAAIDGQFDLQIGVRSRDPASPRRPMTITFVLDTSGSMEGTSIERERAVVRAVAKSLAAGDVISMVTWAQFQNVVLSGHVASGPDDPIVVQAANSLQADGSTDLHAGLVKGYELATEHYGETRLNRIILVSDGGANTGITDEEIIAQHSEDADKEGIYMVGVGTGPASGYNDTLMDTVTDKGRGAYVYIDSVDEADRMFADRFDEVMEVAARSVQIELTLPWYFQMQKFYGEEYSENPKEVEPQHLAPGDAMVLNQIIAACDPAIVDGNDTVAVKAKWTSPLTYTPLETAITMTVDDLLAGSKEQLRKGKAIVAYAEALKSGSSSELAAAHDAVVAANPDGTDPDLNEIAELLELAPAY